VSDTLDALRKLEPYSRAWIEARDRLWREDRDAYCRWLDEEWQRRVDETAREVLRRLDDEP
jgi:hypothetical protein